MLERLPYPRLTIPLALLASAVGALASAFVGEYVFGLEPCVLCLYERVPYGIVAVLAGLAILVRARDGSQAWLVAGCGLVFLAGAALAFYHVGVEQHWWAGFSGCSGTLPQNLTIEDFRASLAEAPRKSCDDVDWRLFGISLAGYNVLVSVALATISFLGARLLFRRAYP
ncbi:MAG: disulfide bond formation protein B [Rhodospirillales bacterium]|nr:disulfide bond formation protein B [Rhodospirillales bacterium]